MDLPLTWPRLENPECHTTPNCGEAAAALLAPISPMSVNFLFFIYLTSASSFLVGICF